MFPIPAPPNIEATDDMRKTVIRLFSSELAASRIMPFFAAAMTFRHKAGKEHGISAWQHGCIDTVGRRYLELLVAHCFLERNPNCTANALNDTTRKKFSLLLEAEKELQLVQVAVLPADLAATRSDPTEGMTRYCHTRLLGALALVAPYSELKDFFKRHYHGHRVSTTAGLSFKGLLQEFSQSERFGLPIYRVIDEVGPAHAKTFKVSVTVGKIPTVITSGNSKKQAEESAAEKWLRANAHSYLQAKILENAHAPKPIPPRYVHGVVPDIDGRTMRALRRFGVSDQNANWLRRALTHPGLRVAKRFPEYEDNRTVSVLGSFIFQAGFSHCIATRYFSTQEFRLQEASLGLLASNAVSANAVEPIANRLEIMRYVSLGPQMRLEDLSINQRASFLEALIAVRFLDQAPNHDLALALGPDVLRHFENVASTARDVEDLKGPLTRLLELAGCQQIRAENGDPIISGPTHQPEVIARINFKSDLPRSALVIRGGKGANGKEARQSLAKTLLPVFRAIHYDFIEARRRSSEGLVDKLSSLLIPAAFAAAPQSAQEAEKWRNLGLLGSKLLSQGDFAKFSLWADEATRHLQKSGVSLYELEERVLAFYKLIGSRPIWDLRAAAEAVISAVKDFASSGDALMKIRSVKRETFFIKMQELLRVLSLAAKANDKQTTVRDAFDGLELLRKRDNQIRWVFDGPDLAINEREGATIELCAEILDALSVPIGQSPLQVSIRTAIQNQKATLIIRRMSNGIGSCQPSERLDGSLLVSFLEAEGFIETIHSDSNEVTCVFPQVRANNFARRAKIAVQSPFAALGEDTRSAFSKLLHDLKNHLIGAEVAVGIETKNRTSVLRAQAEASEHLDAACRLADQFASLAGVLGQVNIDEVSVSDFFKRLCARLFATLPQSVSLGVPGASENVSVRTSEQFIESIIDNLVRNSVDAMNGQGRLELAWEIDEDNSNWVIKVRDTGPGIPQGLLQRLVAGEAVSSSKPGGSGVGMLTVVSMLRRLGGRISGSDHPAGGTEWTLCIPSLPVSKPDDEPVPTEPSNLLAE